MAQNHFFTFYKANLLLSLLLHLSQVPLFANEILNSAKIETEKRSHPLPHWIEELPDSIPVWMKISASNYRGSPQQVTCAMVKMAKALEDMRAARARNCDSYFRCRGSLLAAKCGIYATSFARYIREVFSSSSIQYFCFSLWKFSGHWWFCMIGKRVK